MTQPPSGPRVLIAALALSAAGFVGIVLNENYTDKAVIPIPGDVPTIGFGTTEGVKLGDKTTPPKALARALRDASKYEGALKGCVKVELHQWEYDAMVSAMYNIGPTAFCNSTMVKKLNARDYEGACDELLRWVYAGGRKVAGLVTRRQRERQLCLGAAQRAEQASAAPSHIAVAVPYRLVRQAHLLCPIGEALRFPAVGVSRAHPSVSNLLPVRRPSTVPGLVVSVRVYAIKAVSDRRFAHVSEKVFEGLPSSADLNPAASVERILHRPRVRAAPAHRNPTIKYARAGFAVPETSGVIVLVAAARFLPTVRDVVSEGDDLGTACASEEPPGLPVPRTISDAPNGGESFKLLSSQITQSHLHTTLHEGRG